MEPVKIGDIVKRKTSFSEEDENGNKQPVYGTVIFVHPEGRFHTVAFETKAGIVRESFDGVDK